MESFLRVEYWLVQKFDANGSTGLIHGHTYDNETALRLIAKRYAQRAYGTVELRRYTYGVRNGDAFSTHEILKSYPGKGSSMLCTEYWNEED